MTLYLQEELFSFDHFDIWDETGSAVYTVEREFFTWGRTLHVMDAQGCDVAQVQRIPFSIPSAFSIATAARELELQRNFSFFGRSYSIDSLGWEITGDLPVMYTNSTAANSSLPRWKRSGRRCTTATGWRCGTPLTRSLRCARYWPSTAATSRADKENVRKASPSGHFFNIRAWSRQRRSCWLRGRCCTPAAGWTRRTRRWSCL